MPTETETHPRITVATLMQAAIAVDQECRRLKEQLYGMSEDDDRLDVTEEALMRMSVANAELRRVYEDIQKASDNLPLYSRLVG